jgi:biotin transport system substrate-specific component
MKPHSEVKTLSLQRNETLIKNIILILGFSILTAAGAWIEFRLPFTPVPVTLQSLFVLLAGATIGWKKGALSQLTYLTYGAIGLPVFSGGAMGIAFLFSPTGGYLLAFPIAALVAGLLADKNSGFVRNTFGFLAASAVILLMGTAQLTLFTGQNWNTAFLLGTVPFIAGDFIKSVSASMILSGWNRIKR